MNCDAHGNGNVNIPTISIPTNTINGIPNTLNELITTVGPDNIKISYYVLASGSVPDHECWGTYTLYIQGKLSDGTNTPQIAIANTNNDPKQGGNIYSGWQALAMNVSSLLLSLSSNEKCIGNGCGCPFDQKGGWSNVSVSLRIDVDVNLLNYCTISGTHNIYHNMCYNYLGNYLSNNDQTQTNQNQTQTTEKSNQQISSYLKEYCAQKYPNHNLSLFNDPQKMDPKDYQICACHMPDNNYVQFHESMIKHFPDLNLGTNSPNCLHPACYYSPFKTDEKCAIPSCMNNINVDNNNQVTYAQPNRDADCGSIGIPKPTQQPKPPITHPLSHPPKVQVTDIIIQYKNWILGLFLFILLLLIIILIISSTSSEPNVKNGTSTKATIN